MRKQLVLLAMILLPMVASADAVVVDGICYNLIPKGNAAEVTAYSYSGEVIIPEQFIYDDINYTVISIGGHAFENCNSLTSITIPNSIKSISEYAFYQCAKLSAVKVYDLAAWCNIDFKGFAASPLQYAHRLYVNDEEIVNLVIPSKVTTINKDAFKGCKCITSVTIPNSVTSIGYESFYGCTNLTSVTIGDNNNDVASTIIGGRAFYMCSGLESVTIGNNVKQIERDAFYECTSLASITIPNSVESIGSHVFLGCTNLSSVKLSENISSIEWSTFNGCTSLESIVIPNTVESIGDAAFSGCINLTSINLPSNLSYIGWHTFEGCSKLTSITIPDKVTIIERGTFQYCKSLTDITLGRGIKELCCGSFANCTHLSNVYCYAENAPICNNGCASYYGKAMGAFEDSFIEYATLHVRAQSVDTYKAAESWKNFKEITIIPMPPHTLTYILDGEVYKICQVAEGDAITPEPTPTKEGYTFSGWSDIPEVMPSDDVTVFGSFEEDPNTTYALSCEDLECSTSSMPTLKVMLWNVEEVKLCQFDFRLPSGVTVTTKSNGKLDARLSERAKSHSVSSQRLANGDYRFVVSSLDNESFTGNSGTLLEITLDVSSTVKAGEYTVKVFNTELSVPEGNDLKVVKPADKESKLTIRTYTPGDVNSDGSVSVTDVGCAINYILEQVPSVFIFEAADMNGDKSVSVTDVGMIINFILNDGASIRQRTFERSSYDEGSLPGLFLQPTDEGYELLLEDKDAFTGFQFDVELSNGASISGIRLNGSADSDHLMAYRHIGNGKWRVVCYSPTNSTFVQDHAALLTIITTGGITVSGIRLTTSGLNELRPADLSSMPTGIASMGQGMQVSVQGHKLHISSDCDTTLRLLTVGGNVYRILNVHQGVNSFDGLRAGVYMIENKKIIIR